MGKVQFKQVNQVTERVKDKDRFDYLSNKIVDVVIEIDFSCFRTFVFSYLRVFVIIFVFVPACSG
jgi:hypothetical protein